MKPLFTARVNGMFITKKGEFMPMCQNTRTFNDKAAAFSFAEDKVGRLLPSTTIIEAVEVEKSFTVKE